MNYENLHTSALEKLFGTIKMRIVKQNHDIRIIELNDDQNISRTLGIVKFFNIKGESLIKAHNQILEGQVLGKTLYNSNIDFDKEFLGSVLVNLPNWLKDDFKSEYDQGIGFYSKIKVAEDHQIDNKILYSELIEIIPRELKNAFKDKIIPLENNEENVISLLDGANIKVSKP
ncbi:hypothetical protein RXV94_08835 [Yeosuana sp. MJ-SS3]|uniref:Uncharacterized protein n=1 Tax=Gilvirhabdus luticola TaxID=3079858 RepID=A0ABU3U778_9FLAO|nr:hypothetical protein [Yeosuana sp. MJ-SS3]MDU8886264.1 hypothetical protein [Yeosuana sp. MJ-SS3]